MSERQQNALKTVKHYMWGSMGAGLIPGPLVDLIAVSGVQVKMLAEVSKIYEVPFQKNRGKAIVGSLLGFSLAHSMACGVLGIFLKSIPVVGVLAGGPAMAVFSGASAWALGSVFIRHFESGGTFLDFDPEKAKEYYRTQFEEGRRMATTMGTEVPAEVPV